MTRRHEDREEYLEYLRVTADYYRCTVTGRILVSGSQSDDKVLCPCGQQSPGAERMRRTKGLRGPLEPPGTHFKAFLADAGAEQWLEQSEREEGRRGSPS